MWIVEIQTYKAAMRAEQKILNGKFVLKLESVTQLTCAITFYIYSHLYILQSRAEDNGIFYLSTLMQYKAQKCHSGLSNKF